MASGNMKDIKRRIKSVQSTMQITKAMELVASSKMRHAKERALGARPYFNALYQTITHLAGATRGSESVYTRPREVKNSLYIVIAGDRGLAGGYNANLFKLAAAEMQGKQAQVITIGKKAQEHYAKRPVTVAADYPGSARVRWTRFSCATRSLSPLCSRSRSASSCCPRTLMRQTSSRQALMF